MKYRKKPVVIDAVQLTWENWNALCEMVGDFPDGMRGAYTTDGSTYTEHEAPGTRIALVIPTREGTMLGVEGDFIIRGVQGEFYPCKPDIFAATYEAAE